jgi:hypothetical protein
MRNANAAASAVNSRSRSFRGRGTYGRDAAGGSPMAFLQSELELVSPKLVKPLASVTHQRDITINFGGGFIDYLSSFASDYGTTGSNQYGLQGTNNTDIPQIQTNITKGTWQTVIWQASSVISDLDLKKLQAARGLGIAAPFSLDQLLKDGVQLVWNKAMDKVTYTGWLGLPGIVNNPNVVSSLSPATGTGGLRTWASKTPQQIQADFNAVLFDSLAACLFSIEGMVDTFLMDWNVYNLLTQPYTLGGIGGFSSILEYVKANNIARENGIDLKFFPLANPWISTAGAGGTSRLVGYRNDEDCVKLHVPAPLAPAMTVPSVKDGGSYETLWNGCIGQVQWLRTQTAAYVDGIA